MFNCTVDGGAHVWSISGRTPQVYLYALAPNQTQYLGQFTFTVVNRNPLASQVSVVAHTDLNGTAVMCMSDETGDIQGFILTMLGKFNASLTCLNEV